MIPCLISCDWGSTSFRLRLATAEGDVLEERKSDRGTSTVSEPGLSAKEREARFAGVLAEELATFANGREALPVVVSGMATSAHGWVELPYAEAPLPLDGTGLVTARRQVAGHPVILVSGIRTDRDVMRGEECELLGLLRSRPEFAQGEAVVLLPGTHAKHVYLSDGLLCEFRTAMTGELFGLLKEHSVLRYSFVGEETATTDETTAFLEGVREVSASGLSSALFQVRARSLLSGASPADSAAFLNGLLLGDELRGAELLGGQRILVCASGTRGEQYRQALAELCPEALLKSLDDEELDRLVVFGHLAVLAQENG
jgi:2-dehydro-3-deoxygalactonokinase